MKHICENCCPLAVSTTKQDLGLSMPLEFFIRGQRLSSEQIDALEKPDYSRRFIIICLAAYELDAEAQSLRDWGEGIGLNGIDILNWDIDYFTIESLPEAWQPPLKVAAVLERLRQSLLDREPSAMALQEIWVNRYSRGRATGEDYLELLIDDLANCATHLRRLHEHGEMMVTFESFS